MQEITLKKRNVSLLRDYVLEIEMEKGNTQNKVSVIVAVIVAVIGTLLDLFNQLNDAARSSCE